MAADPPKPKLSRARARAALLEMLIGYRVSQSLYVMAELGLADHLAAGPKTVTEIAERCGAHAPSISRLLRALASVDLVASQDADTYALSPLGELLCSDAKGSVRGEVRYHAHPACWQPWGQLLEAVKTGEPSFSRAFGTNAWDYRAAHPEVNDLFNEAMRAHSGAQRDVILAHADFSEAACVVDVGGGTGTLVAALLDRHAHLRGILFDQPHVVAGATSVLAEAGVAERCEVAAGSFLERIPTGGDLYILKAILHNWDDEHAAQILRNCREAMVAGGRLLIVEWVMDPSKASRGSFLDLHMLVILGGRERTASEYESLLAGANFATKKVTTALSGDSLIEATAI